jgi:sugar lactone lactonase YvrE
MRRCLGAAAVATLFLVSAFGGAASAQGKTPPGVQVSVLTTFAPGEHAGGVAATNTGDVHVSVGANVVRVGPDGQQKTLTTISGGLFGGPIGLAFNRFHQLFAAFPTGSGTILQISPNGASTTPVPGSQGMVAPDGFGFDSADNMYVTDISGNSLWRVTPGGTAQLWSADPLLVLPDGVKVFNNAAYVSVEGGQIVKIPINPDATAGTGSVWASSPRDLFDDMVLDDRTGDVYVASLNRNRVLQITPDGDVTPVATYQDGLVTPANMALIHIGKSTVIYVGNMYRPGASGSDPNENGGPGPAVFKITIRDRCGELS